MRPEQPAPTPSYYLLRGPAHEDNRGYDRFMESEEHVALVKRLVSYKDELDEHNAQLSILFAASIITFISCGALTITNATTGKQRVGAITGISAISTWYTLALLGLVFRRIFNSPKYTAISTKTTVRTLTDEIARLELNRFAKSAACAGFAINALPTLISGIVVLIKPEVAFEANKIAGFAFVAIFAATACITITQIPLWRQSPLSLLNSPEAID